jgi:hypothetical protein
MCIDCFIKKLNSFLQTSWTNYDVYSFLVENHWSDICFCTSNWSLCSRQWRRDSINKIITNNIGCFKLFKIFTCELTKNQSERCITTMWWNFYSTTYRKTHEKWDKTNKRKKRERKRNKGYFMLIFFLKSAFER